MDLYRFDSYLFGVAGGWLCLTAAVFFVIKRPAANAVLNLTLVGFGGAPLIGSLTYARLAALVGGFTILRLLIRRKQAGALRSTPLLRLPLSWFCAVCLLVLSKILTETVFYGLDASRAANLEIGLTEALFPVLIFYLGIAREGLESTARDLMVGMITFPFFMVVGYLPLAVNEGLFASVLEGVDRFTFGVADTISTARVLAYGAITAVLFVELVHRRRGAQYLFVACISGALLFLLLLTGNRQFLIAVFCFLFIALFNVQLAVQLRWLYGLVILGSFGFAFYYFTTARTLVLEERMSNYSFQEEVIEGRGLIWTGALKSVIENPLLGVGFKNFGEEIEGGVDRSGRTVTLRDSAHGVLQDLFVEHGLLIGFAFLAGCVHLVVRSLKAIQTRQIFTAEKALTIILLALIVPLLFSSVFLNATPIYLLLALTMVRDGQRHAQRS